MSHSLCSKKGLIAIAIMSMASVSSVFASTTTDADALYSDSISLYRSSAEVPSSISQNADENAPVESMNELTKPSSKPVRR